jgi:hypothetical protein
MLIISEKSLNFLSPLLGHLQNQLFLQISKDPWKNKEYLEVIFNVCKSLSEITSIAEKDNIFMVQLIVT